LADIGHWLRGSESFSREDIVPKCLSLVGGWFINSCDQKNDFRKGNRKSKTLANIYVRGLEWSRAWKKISSFVADLIIIYLASITENQLGLIVKFWCLVWYGNFLNRLEAIQCQSTLV
jgi:hypothetical protein